MDETAFMKIGDKFKANKHIGEKETPNERNAEATGKFALRHWERWEESTTKLADETKEPELWRKVNNFKNEVEEFAHKATKLANDFKSKQQFKKVKKHSLGRMMEADDKQPSMEPSRNMALFKPGTLLKDVTITEFK